MGKITGFIELQRIKEATEPTARRVTHYREFILTLADDEASRQGARCMDCGIPFCQTGCPVNNIIPDWNDLTYRRQWRGPPRDPPPTKKFLPITRATRPPPLQTSLPA